MKEARLKTTEIQDAAQAYIASGFNDDAMRPLMNLMSWQTAYVQKRFWKIVDAYCRNAVKECKAQYEAERVEA
jgi:hypothetical protein